MHKRSKILSISIAICLILMTFSSLGTVFIDGEQNTEGPDASEGPLDLSEYIIAVDPGHGGSDSGAVGPSGYLEKECVLDIGLRLRDLLEANGAEVVMTRETDVYVGLSERADIANNAGTDIFISLHNNAFDGNTKGIESFYHEDLPSDSDAAQLTTLLQDELIAEIDSPDRGVKTANYAVLRETWMPASLTENMFIDNPDEEAKLMDPDIRQRIAEAHYRAICDYFGVDPSPPGEAEFVLNNWSAAPDTVEPGETVTIDGEVENIGDDEDTVPIELYINGEYTDTQWKSLAPGESTGVSFQHSEEEEGTYDVWVFEYYDGIGDEWEGEFTVEQETGAPAPPDNLTIEHHQDNNSNEEYILSDTDLDSEIDDNAFMGYEDGESGECCSQDCSWRFTYGEDINPDPVEAGDTVTISGEVIHDNGQNHAQALVSLYIDGTEVDNLVTGSLGWDETESFSFDRTIDSPGTYDVDLYVFYYDDGIVGGWWQRWNSSFEVTEESYPEFELSDWSTMPNTVETNETVTIEGNITNVGDESGDVSAELYVGDDYVASKWDTLDPNETKTFTHTHSESEEGQHHVRIAAWCELKSPPVDDEWNGEFEVLDAANMEVETIGTSDVNTDSATLEGELLDMGGMDAPHNQITWDASPDDASGEVDYYNIYRSEDENGPWDNPIENVVANGSSDYGYIDDDAAGEPYYWYIVRAVGTNGIEEGNSDSAQEPVMDPDVQVFFRYKESGDTTWQETQSQQITSEGMFYEYVSGLKSDTEYEFEAVVQWDSEEDVGLIETFRTDTDNYSLEIVAEEGGTTDPEPGTYIYEEGTEVTIEAIPDESWKFENWSVDNQVNIENRQENQDDIIYGFWPHWTDPTEYEPNWEELTHVSVFSITAQSDGSLYEGNMDHYDDVKNASEGTDTDVTLTITQFDQDIQDEILAYHKQDLVDNVVSVLDDYDADGVNIDIEFVRETNSITGESNVDLMEELLLTLYQDVKAENENYHISFCTAGSVEEVYRNSQLSEYTDHVFLMGYDYHWSGAQNTGPVSPYDSEQYFDVTDSMDILRDYYLDKQLVMGLPFYGYEWPAESNEPGAATEGDGESVFMTEAVDNADVYGRNWHEDSSVPWYAYEENGQWYQGWYDDEESLEMKWRYVKNQSLGGTGFWALGYETEEVWDTIKNVFSDNKTTITLDGDKVVTAHFVEKELHTMDITLNTEGDAEGWNFVSFNLDLENTDLGSILEDEEYGIIGNYDKVMYYDSVAEKWLSHVPGREEHFNELNNWDHKMGIWIQMNADDTLTVEGTEPTRTNITLDSGWNMVSYPSSTATVEGTPDKVTIVGYFDGAKDNNLAYSYDPQNFEFSPGEGYYLYNDADSEVTWTIEY
ncbi:MAG: N-acetylmuramoyl-L-alanine amidase [Candidatus Saliniplasma sp.]